MAIKIKGSTIVDDNRNILSANTAVFLNNISVGSNASINGTLSISGNTVFNSGLVTVDSQNKVLLIGTSTAYPTRYAGSSVAGEISNSPLQVHTAATSYGFDSNANFIRWSTGTVGGRVQLGKSKGNLIGTHTIVANNDFLGDLQFLGSDGSEFIIGSTIRSIVDDTPSSNNIPSSIAFMTTGKGNGSNLTTRMLVSSNGNIGINNTLPNEKLDIIGNIRITGGISANGSLGTSGQVLTSTGTGIVWSTVSGGGGGSTNLSTTANSSTITILSDTGTDVTITEANTTTAGIMTAEYQILKGHKLFANTVSIGTTTFLGNTLTVGGKLFSRDMFTLYKTGTTTSEAGIAKMWVDGTGLTIGITGALGILVKVPVYLLATHIK